ncbi:MAG: tRNA (adenosine(37)-N6)-threonylcarbamoyltransferase complex dimerization subunit type 1 TsaB [Eubacteriales bacterium]|nr:tRNA (adenosine(37)-N6)-threonylcarbamoyltransferase complex dimerization subunit type 1 TsaB [Eubacteriales bacterium]
MTILALDTSGPVCSAAVMAAGSLSYEARAVNKLTHSRNLLPMVEEALGKAGMSVNDIGLVAAIVGPGSFTGVRIAVATAQGIARARGIKCLPVNALEAMAASFLSPESVICPIRDARSMQVYGAAFRDGKRLMEDAALPLTEYLAQVSAFEGQLLFAGDGVAPCRDRILESLGSRALFAPAHLVLPGAGAAAYLASLRADEAVPPGELKPLYLRAPQAERLRAQKHG